MTTIIPLRVTGLDMSDDATACRLYEQWGAELATKNDVTMLLLTIDDTDDIISTVADSISQITLAFPEVVAESVYRDLVSLSDIADRVGVTKEAVRKWTMLTTTPFPHQFSTIGAGQKVWDWIDVYDWLTQVKKFDMEDEFLPTRKQVIAIDAYLARIPIASNWNGIISNSRLRPELIPIQWFLVVLTCSPILPDSPHQPH